MRATEIRELQGKDTFVMKSSGLYPATGEGLGQVAAVDLAGAKLLA